MKYIIALLVLTVTLCSSTFVQGDTANPGFLIVAMDRGAMGNKEMEILFESFSKDYPSALTFIGWEEERYKSYFLSSLKELKAKGVNGIVVIPLIVSRHDPYFEKMEKTAVAALKEVFGSDIRFAVTPPLGESYLFSQILFDRIAVLSKEPEQERLVLIGLGAANTEQADKIKEEFDAMLNRVRHFWSFKETASAVFFHNRIEKSVRDEGNGKALQVIINAAAKRGRTIVVSMAIGAKTDSAMSFSGRLQKSLSDTDVTLSTQELLEHENILLYLKKMANMHSPAKSEEIGVVLMPHGSDKLWNDAVEKTIEPLKAKYPVEIAYGMADYLSIQEAVSRLEARGIKHIIFGRMYALHETMKAESDYVLGLSMEPSGHDHHNREFRQIRSSAVFTTFGGYEEDTDVAGALLERIEEMSEDPSKETILLLAHGSGDDRINDKWISVMARNVENIKKLSTKPFKNIKVATLREDWPDKMAVSLKGIQKIIEDGNRNGRVIVIPNRIAGSGPYQRVLKGMNYEMNPNGIAPHSFITRWLEREIQKALGMFDLAYRPPSEQEKAEMLVSGR